MDDKQLQVLIPYKLLSELLESPKKVAELEKELKHQMRMIGALRGQLMEVVEKLKSE